MVRLPIIAGLGFMANASEWISVGALGAAFEPDSHILPESAALAGRRLPLHLENGELIEYRFASATKLERTLLAGGPADEARATDAITYSATEIRPNLYFVSFIEPQRRASTSALLLDLSNGMCTLVRGQLPTREEASKPFFQRIANGEELTGVSAELIAATIGAPFDANAPRHAPTSDLVGKRVEYTYSVTERYEHIYLNERLYTWHCLAGSEQGLADTDRCHYLKLAPELYLFVWREKIVPTLGIVVVDLQQMKTTGRIVGYKGFDFGAITSFPVGARVRILSGA
jgi:hypothetical protein